jgi:hypothetical protein
VVDSELVACRLKPSFRENHDKNNGILIQDSPFNILRSANHCGSVVIISELDEIRTRQRMQSLQRDIQRTNRGVFEKSGEIQVTSDIYGGY